MQGSESAPGNTPGDRPRRRRLFVGGLTLATVALIGAAGFWFLFGGEEPAEVSLEGAVGSGDSETPSTRGEVATDASGTWNVDPSATAADGSVSFAGFRVEEELGQGIGHTTAVGRTETVAGSIVISGTTVESAEFTVGLTGIESDRPRRDERIQEALETGSHPEATFVLTEPIDLGTAPAEGESVGVEAVGDLTIHGVTKQATFDLEAQLSGGVLVVVGSSDVVFADYGVDTPSSMIVVSIEDHGTIELQLLMQRG